MPPTTTDILNGWGTAILAFLGVLALIVQAVNAWYRRQHEEAMLEAATTRNDQESGRRMGELERRLNVQAKEIEDQRALTADLQTRVRLAESAVLGFDGFEKEVRTKLDQIYALILDLAHGRDSRPQR